MKYHSFADNNYLISDGKLICIRSVESGTKIFGFNRQRDLCSHSVAIKNIQEKVCGYQIWTNKGDVILLSDNKVISPSGLFRAKDLYNDFLSFKQIRIEMPRIHINDKLYKGRLKSFDNSLGTLLLCNKLPIFSNGQTIIKVPKKNSEDIIEKLKNLDIALVKCKSGSKWSWLIIEGEFNVKHKNKKLESTAMLNEETIKLAYYMTCFQEEGNDVNIINHNAILLRVMLIAYYFYYKIPFDISVYPTNYPIEIKFKRALKWGPYAKSLYIKSIETTKIGLGFEDDHFIPLINNFMILS